MSKYPTIGVLGIQGDFIEHINILKCIGYCNIIDVRNNESLNVCDGLIIPGGESTTIGIILNDYKLINSLKKFIMNPNKIIWGICAGLIILSNKIENSQILYKYNDKTSNKDYTINQPLIGGLNVISNRNYFGSQVDSALRTIYIKDDNKIYESQSHFIRAPIITKICSDNIKEVCYAYDDNNNRITVGVYDTKLNIMGTAFHPEVTYNSNDVSIKDRYWHELFIKKCYNKPMKILKSLPIKPFKSSSINKGIWSVKIALPRMLCGGVIMDVVNETQARIAEEAGACSVMALERIPADIKQNGGIARMSDPELIIKIKNAVSIPVMAKSRIGHFGEAKILESLNIDCIDESEVLTPADETYHINKHKFVTPFVCGAKNLGEALRRIAEGAAMIRLKGNAGTGNVMHAVRHARLVFGEINKLKYMNDDEIYDYSKSISAPVNLVKLTKKLGRLPVTTFAAGGISTPADVILMMEMGVDGVFVGSGIFKSDNPTKRARAIVHACTYWKFPKIVANVSKNLGKAMVGILDDGEQYRFMNKDSKL